jgi:hypothetical protein
VTGAAWRGQGRPARDRARARGPVQDGAKVAGVAHMAGQSSGCVRQRNKGGGREVDKRGLKWNFTKIQGLHCKV